MPLVKGSRALAILRNRTPKTISKRDYGFDPIMDSMIGTMEDLRRLHFIAGDNMSPEVEVADGVVIMVDRADPGQPWEHRLRGMIEDSVAVSRAHDLEAGGVLQKLMKADGWAVNPKTVKTPPWMDEFCEFSVSEFLSMLDEAVSA